MSGVYSVGNAINAEEVLIKAGGGSTVRCKTAF